MGTQLWIDHRGSGEPCADRVKTVANREYGWLKPAPKCALWTSTYGEEYGWLGWLRTEGWLPDAEPLERVGYWLLEPDPQARIFEIDTYADLEQLVERYPYERVLVLERTVDWEAVARDGWAGVHLTDAGQWATRLSHPLTLYGWDCESTLWFRWAFVGEPRKISYDEALAAHPAPA